MNLANEPELVVRAQAGDRAAFSALVDRYWLPLCRWLNGLTGNSHSAEDLTQDTFVRAWSALPALEDRQAFRAWLFRIARNAMLVQQRGPRGKVLASLSEDYAQSGAGPPAEAMEREAMNALRSAIQRLPEPYRAAYLLWTQDEFPYSEIARILSISEQNARWRVHESRRLLAKQLRAHLESPST